MRSATVSPHDRGGHRAPFQRVGVAGQTSTSGRPAGTILNLGCGRQHVDGAVNVDCNAGVAPDVRHDLNGRPWPLAGASFNEVLAYDVIEHLDDVVATMDEIHRVCRHGARVKITVPHFSCANAFTDVTHKHYFGWFSFDYCTSAHELSFYTTARFARRYTGLMFYPSVANRLISRLANRFPVRYERRWAWLFPAWFLYFELEVVKERR